MGIFRLLLALSVVAAHSSSFFGTYLVGGKIAVQAFYIISGFYMSLILSEKYIGKAGSYKLFISNRFLRIFPIFWAVLLLTILFGTVMLMFGDHSATVGVYANYLSQGGHFDIFAIGLLIISNLFLFGGDLVMFLGLNSTTGHLFFTPDFTMTTPRLHGFLFVPQAWTIAIELMFYLIAPFIVRQKTWIIGTIIALSLGLRWYLYAHGFNHDPWTHRLFPLELAFFLIGTLTYRLYTKIKTYTFDQRVLYTALSAIGLATGLYYPGNTSVFHEASYFALVVLCLPLLFIVTKNSKFDSKIGELSYPVYICHILVITIVTFFSVQVRYMGPFIAVLSIGFALLLNRFIADPIERFRQRRVRLAK